MKLSRVNRFHDPASLGEKIQEEDLADLSRTTDFLAISKHQFQMILLTLWFLESIHIVSIYKESQNIRKHLCVSV